MSDKTRIEWADATWNPVTGCTKVSDGCKHCYAERDWARLSANPKTRYYGRSFTNVQCHYDLLEQPLRWSKPRRIFVNSMSDLFHPDVPDSFIRQIFGVMATEAHHTFQVLTKRPKRMCELLRQWRADDVFMHHDGMAPSNVWLGVSVEDQATAEERVYQLLDTPAFTRWISAEPLLGPVDLSRWLELGGLNTDRGLSNPGIDWVVAGGESGPKARPMHPDWVRSLRDQCAAADVPFLFKQWGEFAPNWYNDDGGQKIDGSEWMDLMRKKLAGRTLDGVIHDDYPIEVPF